MNVDIFANQTLCEIVCVNQDENAKKFKARRYYLPKGFIKNYNVIISGKNF